MDIFIERYKTLGEYIRALRLRLALTQAELAEALKVRRQSVSLWETDKAGPRTRTLKELCNLCGVSYDKPIQKFYFK